MTKVGQAITALSYYKGKLNIDKELELAIKALERDTKVDYITEHWNDEKSTFVFACSAFENILKVYGRGISEETDNDKG